MIFDIAEILEILAYTGISVLILLCYAIVIRTMIKVFKKISGEPKKSADTNDLKIVEDHGFCMELDPNLQPLEKDKGVKIYTPEKEAK